MDGKIALEEHWAIDQTLNIAGQPVGAGAFWDETRRLLVDFRDRRLAEMDANGIELAILGLNSPALQAILDPAEAVGRRPPGQRHPGCRDRAKPRPFRGVRRTADAGP